MLTFGLNSGWWLVNAKWIRPPLAACLTYTLVPGPASISTCRGDQKTPSVEVEIEGMKSLPRQNRKYRFPSSGSTNGLGYVYAKSSGRVVSGPHAVASPGARLVRVKSGESACRQ